MAKSFFYVPQLPKNRLEKLDEKQGLLVHQHFWSIGWAYLLYAHHYLPVS
jgi:hypothetical protein